jgi:hypothetical protein
MEIVKDPLWRANPGKCAAVTSFYWKASFSRLARRALAEGDSLSGDFQGIRLARNGSVGVAPDAAGERFGAAGRVELSRCSGSVFV